jgi:hypothetical protein
MLTMHGVGLIRSFSLSGRKDPSFLLMAPTNACAPFFEVATGHPSLNTEEAEIVPAGKRRICDVIFI